MPKTLYIFIQIVVVGLVVFSCQPSTSKTEAGLGRNKDYVRYATKFKVHFGEGFKVVEVPLPWKDASSGKQYLLLQKGIEKPQGYEQATVVNIPLNTIACTSTSHIPALEMINEHGKLTGFAQSDYICSETVRKRIDNGQIRELGSQNGLNIESLIQLDPDVLMAFSMGNENGTLKQAENAGIPVVINADYLEESPLARAEWIKFMALFFNKEKEADSVFKVVENEYLRLQALAQETQEQPKVYCGIVYGDIWYIPGGKSWASTFLADAGADYVWKDTDAKGSLELGFEAVYEKAGSADLWIGVASFTSLEEIKQSDERYTYFEAFKNGNVYTYSGRLGAKGGNDYLETGYLRPDWVLSDLIKIVHPQLLPDYELYFYRQLK